MNFDVIKYYLCTSKIKSERMKKVPAKVEIIFRKANRFIDLTYFN
jgi:hypothetical protein